MVDDEDTFESIVDELCSSEEISESDAKEIGEAIGNAIFDEESKPSNEEHSTMTMEQFDSMLSPDFKLELTEEEVKEDLEHFQSLDKWSEGASRSCSENTEKELDE
jgi:hypothetical protein